DSRRELLGRPHPPPAVEARAGAHRPPEPAGGPQARGGIQGEPVRQPRAGVAEPPRSGDPAGPGSGLDSGAWMGSLRRIPARARIGLRPVGGRAPLAASLVGLQVNWPLAVLAVLATLVVVVLLVPMLRGPKEHDAPPTTGHRERRRAPVTGRREAREALALVGEALAATHNPRALMPVVLNVITEATGARGGRLLHDGEEVGWVGDVDGDGRAVEFDLSAGDETAAMTLVLNPPEGGFS